MPAIDIDRDTAHDAAQRELDKPIYPKGSSRSASTSGFMSCCTALWNKARRCPVVGSPPVCC